MKETKFPPLQLQILALLAGKNHDEHWRQKDILAKIWGRKDSISRAFITLFKKKGLIQPRRIQDYQESLSNNSKTKKGKGTFWEITDLGTDQLVKNINHLEPVHHWKLIFSAFDPSMKNKIKPYKDKIFPTWYYNALEPDPRYYMYVFKMQLDLCKKFVMNEDFIRYHHTHMVKMLEAIWSHKGITKIQLMELMDKFDDKMKRRDVNYNSLFSEILTGGLIHVKPVNDERLWAQEDYAILSLTQFGVLVLINNILNKSLQFGMRNPITWSEPTDRYSHVRDEKIVKDYINKVITEHKEIFPRVYKLFDSNSDLNNMAISSIDRLTMWYFENVNLFHILHNSKGYWKLLDSSFSVPLFDKLRMKATLEQMKQALIEWAIENNYQSRLGFTSSIKNYDDEYRESFLSNVLLNADLRFILEKHKDLPHYYRKGYNNELSHDNANSIVEKIVTPIIEIVKFEILVDPNKFCFQLLGTNQKKYNSSLLGNLGELISYHLISVMKTNYPNDLKMIKQFIDNTWYNEWHYKLKTTIIDFEESNILLLQSSN